MGLFPKERDLSRTLESVELRVEASALGQRVEDVKVRLDAFLARHLKWRSRTSVQDLVRDGYVSVDASTPDHPRGCGSALLERRPGRRLRHGSRVVIQIPSDLVVHVPEFGSDELTVLYEDEDLVAVDKAPFVSVHPSGRHMRDSLIHRVHQRYRETIAERGWAPKLCHRLDRETSGIVLVAKDAEMHRRVMRAFEQREVEKHYLALVQGIPVHRSGVIEMPLGPARASRIGLKMAATVDGVPARTDWELVEVRGAVSLIRCRLHTGRQHQIRVHMSAIGHPVLGDKLYGEDEQYFQRGVEGELSARDLEELLLPRHALHNHRLAFDHPRGGERVVVESPLAPDLAAYFEGCGGPAPRQRTTTASTPHGSE